MNITEQTENKYAFAWKSVEQIIKEDAAEQRRVRDEVKP